MQNSYLIQRLKTPFESEGLAKGLVNAFAFGGGLVNGGLSKEAMELLGDIFRFDYMGSAEFEWGAVPKALSKIADSIESYIAFGEDVKYKYRQYYYGRKKDPEDLSGKAKVYIICLKDDKEEVVDRIKKFAVNHKDCFTKERVCLDEVLSGSSEYNKDLGGWLELDNGYFFFTDKEMYAKTCRLFGIETKENSHEENNT